MNETIETFTRDTIRDKLSLCTESQQKKFRRIYGGKSQELSNEEVIVLLPVNKLDSSLSLIERTLRLNAAGGGE